MKTVGVYSFETKVVSRGYYVYKETSWSKDRDEEEVRLMLSLKQVKVPKKLTHTLVPFMLKRNISKDGKQ